MIVSPLNLHRHSDEVAGSGVVITAFAHQGIMPSLSRATGATTCEGYYVETVNQDRLGEIDGVRCVQCSYSVQCSHRPDLKESGLLRAK